MGLVVIQFVVFKDIHAAVCMMEQVVGVAAHNQSSSHWITHYTKTYESNITTHNFFSMFKSLSLKVIVFGFIFINFF